MANAQSCRTGFSAVGGLEWQLDRLHQMVLMPSMCREVYDRFHVKPPRGIIFYGPPGTGKTLVAGALARECSQVTRKVEFFYRKSADILNMWLGESEKALMHLFEEARRRRPAIIFFDEIDGLAPARSMRADHVHTSIVSTLLALMDGLDDASEIIVIGATNRIEAVDPALRRPGRFDVELFFPLPDAQARLEILRRLLSLWRDGDRPSEDFLRELALSTAGYCGADLQALCRDAVTCGLCRQFPTLASHRDSARPSPVSLRRVQIQGCDFLEAQSRIVPASCRIRSCVARQLSPAVRPLFESVLGHVVRKLRQTCPFQFLHPNDRHEVLEVPTHSCRLVVCGTPHQGHTCHLAPALLHHLQHLPVYCLDVVALFDSSRPNPEAACIQVVTEARSNMPSVLYLPDVSGWWGQASLQMRTVLLALVRDLDPGEPLLLLATANHPYTDLHNDLQELFREEMGRVVHMRNPAADEREAYLRPLHDEVVRPPHPPGHPSTLLEPSDPANEGHRMARNSDTEAYIKRTNCLRNGKPGVAGRKPSVAETCERRSSRKRCSLMAAGPVSKTARRRLPNMTTPIRKDRGQLCSPELSTDLPGEDLVHEPDHPGGHVDIDETAVDDFFDHMVSATENCPFQTLEIVHSGLTIIIRKYSTQFQRQQLLLDMQVFMKHFEENLKQH